MITDKNVASLPLQNELGGKNTTIGYVSSRSSEEREKGLRSPSKEVLASKLDGGVELRNEMRRGRAHSVSSQRSLSEDQSRKRTSSLPRALHTTSPTAEKSEIVLPLTPLLPDENTNERRCVMGIYVFFGEL